MDASMCLNENSQKSGETNANADATDADMGINDNAQESGRTITKTFHNDQHATKPAQINNFPGNQYYCSMLTSRVHFKSLVSLTPDKRHPGNNLVILSRFPLRINPIHLREIN